MMVFVYIIIGLCVMWAIGYGGLCAIDHIRNERQQELDKVGYEMYNKGFADALKFCEGTDKAIERIEELTRKHSSNWYPGRED